MVESITTKGKWMEGILWILLHPSHVILDTEGMDQVQGLVKYQDTGIIGHHIAAEVKKWKFYFGF